MSDATLTIGTVFLGGKSVYASNEGNVATNETQEVIVRPDTARNFMIASEGSLKKIWMTPEEDEVWKDL